MSQIKFLYFSFIRTACVFVALVLLNGCSTYSNKWGCKDARGLPCEMLSEVDEKVNSGEIKEVYKTRCASGKCSDSPVIPKLPKIKAKKYKAQNEENITISEDDKDKIRKENTQDLYGYILEKRPELKDIMEYLDRVNRDRLELDLLR